MSAETRLKTLPGDVDRRRQALFRPGKILPDKGEAGDGPRRFSHAQCHTQDHYCAARTAEPNRRRCSRPEKESESVNAADSKAIDDRTCRDLACRIGPEERRKQHSHSARCETEFLHD